MMKSNVNEKRRSLREKAHLEALELKKAGKKAEARSKFMQAVHITKEVRNAFIRVLVKMEIEYYIAPYEADSQLAFMFLSKRAQVVITEDSDLMVFGVTRCFFKMDKAGNGREIDLDDLHKVTELDFSTFSDDMFLKMAVLSGCDYLDSIKGIGLKKAHKMILEQKNGDIKPILEKIAKEGKLEIPESYVHKFNQAIFTFKFQVVYDPTKNQNRYLNDPETHDLGAEFLALEDRSFLGDIHEKSPK